MAFRRSLSSRGTLIARRYQPSFAYIFHDDDRKTRPLNESRSQPKPGVLGQQRSFGTGFSNSSPGIGVLFQDRRCSHLAFFSSTGISFGRYMSSIASDGAKEVELMTDVAEAFKDTAIEAVTQVPAVNEVAIAAADCWLPVATLQYVIDAVHSFTGFNWWASIAVTTVLIRGSTLPLLINQLKATTKMTLMRPRLEEIKERMASQGSDSLSMTDGQNEMKKLFKEYGVTPFTPLKGLFIQGPVFVSFFLAITTMAEKMPSFKYGGAYWFTDLSTPDSLYIFPALTALTFLVTVESNMLEGMEGNPAAKTMKNVSRVLAVLTVPFTMSFPKAIFCYWITSNLFSLTYGLVLKAPGVKKALGVPEIPEEAAVTTPRPSIDLYTALKQTLKQAKTASQQSTALPVEPTKASNQRTSTSSSSSSSTINQRLKNLEKQVKGRKKNKKR
ncbi:ARABIDOPSIS THALIANA HOMOLOG OF YEAST OXIDASE ASSEMBLY 1 (OXA1) [Hibiscus trionum]|uniref:ARABIDOPSIS THALIANA HOMOLOG OF YEAST OXIDASE ASSEMBLY 1 (OXA1) n=1 Tax=Hibiscus trionum TaxID=183268 RepID=A0A9W7MR31_HIBTR|nr:ARABIDOPSIS THALIANA HOMOLOG OF YEAST OXIDASE ASSEMBLY 1 (OXA1) [Hibiscus trionum]